MGLSLNDMRHIFIECRPYDLSVLFCGELVTGKEPLEFQDKSVLLWDGGFLWRDGDTFRHLHSLHFCF